MNYLEIVSFDEFVATQGAALLIEEDIARGRNTLKSIVSQLPNSSLLNIGVDAERVLESLTTDTEAVSKVSSKLLEDLASKVKRIQALRDALVQSAFSNAELEQLVGAKAVRQFREKVIRNQTSDLHFLPAFPSPLGAPSLILLRSISTCSFSYLLRAHNSQNDREWEQVRVSHPIHEGERGFARPERVARLKAPYLQSLMARVGALFARVGVPDLPESLISLTIGSEQ